MFLTILTHRTDSRNLSIKEAFPGLLRNSSSFLHVRVLPILRILQCSFCQLHHNRSFILECKAIIYLQLLLQSLQKILNNFGRYVHLIQASFKPFKNFLFDRCPIKFWTIYNVKQGEKFVKFRRIIFHKKKWRKLRLSQILLGHPVVLCKICF